MKKTPYEQVQEFHKIFDPVHNQTPHSLDKQEVLTRIHFLLEELFEYGATIVTDKEELGLLKNKFYQSIDAAESKMMTKDLPNNSVVHQADALIDLLYLTYGTFVLMGIDPMPLFDIVHEANMGKLFPDGQPHYDEITGKVLKPNEWYEKYAPEQKIKEEIEKQKRDK